MKVFNKKLWKCPSSVKTAKRIWLLNEIHNKSLLLNQYHSFLISIDINSLITFGVSSKLNVFD